MGKQSEATHSACMRVASGSVGVAGRRRKILRARSIITTACARGAYPTGTHLSDTASCAPQAERCVGTVRSSLDNTLIMLRHVAKNLGSRLSPARAAAVNFFHTSPLVESSLPKKNGTLATSPAPPPAMRHRFLFDLRERPQFTHAGTTQVGEGPKALSSTPMPTDLSGGKRALPFSPFLIQVFPPKQALSATRRVNARLKSVDRSEINLSRSL